MRYKKGTKVEVLNTRETPSGSWRTAEVISGNGHTYSVRYDQYLSKGSAMVERVPRKAIRPCPPEVKSLENWVPGDFVEVFDDNSWKIALVCKVLDDNCYLVRLLGSSKMLRTQTFDLRVHQTWQDDRWIVIQKDSGKHDSSSLSKGGNFSHRFPLSRLETDNFSGENQFTNGSNDAYEKTIGVISGRCSRKRPSDASLPSKRCAEAPRKMRALKKTRRRPQIVARHPMQLPEKVDAVASPRIMLGEKYMHSSINNRRAGCSIMESGRGLSEMNNQYCLLRSSEPSHAESTSSSVGSCSVNNSPYRSSHHRVTYVSEDLPSHSNDAESFCSSRREFSLLGKQVFEEESRQLELQAYRSTLMAFYASGPISWEQEALLTNLRIKLGPKLDACKACFDGSVMMVELSRLSHFE